jgi:signal transduction histidine kinase
MRISMLASLEKEKEALNANAELITSMSHDIRTPLTVLLGYLDIMKTLNSDEKIKDYIQASEATALKLKELSDDMFRYFLVFGGSDIEVNIEAYDAKTLFEQMFSEHILLLSEKGYVVNVQIGSAVKDGLQVLTDAPKVMRVIDNLFSNIYKYADKEKRITVAVGVARGKLNVAIKNYVLEDQSKAESNGVGLKTCKKICESLGMTFDYGITGIKNTKLFTARLEFGIVRKDAEAKVNEDKLS